MKTRTLRWMGVLLPAAALVGAAGCYHREPAYYPPANNSPYYGTGGSGYDPYGYPPAPPVAVVQPNAPAPAPPPPAAHPAQPPPGAQAAPAPAPAPRPAAQPARPAPSASTAPRPAPAPNRGAAVHSLPAKIDARIHRDARGQDPDGDADGD